MYQPSEAFFHCWRAAAQHIERQGQGPLAWLKARLEPPFLEHLSFRLGNQLFFVRVEDDQSALEVPGSVKGLLRIADDCKGHPCIMTMQHRSETWSPVDIGWGLRHARTGEPVDPAALMTDDLIEMTDWEVHDFAVMVVRQHLEEQGREIIASAGDPGLDPALWFKGDRGSEWVVVRAVRHPDPEPAPPAKWAQIAQSCAHLSATGHFVAIRVASANDAFDPEGLGAMPLWRGHPMVVNKFRLVRPDRPPGMLKGLLSRWRH